MPNPNISVAPGDSSMELLRCNCGEWSRLELCALDIECNGIRITGPMPSLVCDACGSRRLAFRAKIATQGMAEKARAQNQTSVRVDVTKAPLASRRFSLGENPSLKYSALDYRYIPGLERPEDDGFLTPLFFSIDILTYFNHHPNYQVVFASNTYGTIYTPDTQISFGLNRNNKMIMWLGDVGDLSDRDQLMLAAHSEDSDHDIGSEFYEGQIEAIFTDLSSEQRLIRVQGEFAARLAEDFGRLRLLKMDAEAVTLLQNLRRPIHFSEQEFGDAMETMTKLFIERLDIVVLKQDLRNLLSEEERTALQGLRELKTLQMWLLKKLQCADAVSIMVPFFVLYDLRVAFKHMIPESRKEEFRLSALSRLALPADASLEALYDKLIESLDISFTRMRDACSGTNPPIGL